MPGITAVVAVVVAVALATASRAPGLRLAWLGLAVLACITWRFAPAALLFVPPAALNIAFALFFGATLVPGREPRIATFARLERGELRPAIAKYARGLTWVWTVFFLASATIGVLLAAFAPLEVWSAFVNVGSYIAVAALFFGEYVYRRFRFPHDPHVSLAAFVRLVMHHRHSRR